MKRFTETAKWEDPWYRRLAPELKLLWQWLLDSCDHAGVIEVDLELASFQIGIQYPLDTLSKFGERVQKLDCGKHFIPKFIPFQYGEISKDCRAHRPVFQSLEKHEVKGYAKGIHTRQDNTHTIQGHKEGGPGETPPAPPVELNPAPPSESSAVAPGDPVRDQLRQHRPFVAAWVSWKQHLADMSRTMTRGQEGAILRECGRFGPDRAIEVIEFSISKGAKNLIWDDAPKKRQPGASRTAGPRDPVGWAEWRDENYPGADKSVPFAQVSRDIQKEFEKSQKP